MPNLYFISVIPVPEGKEAEEFLEEHRQSEETFLEDLGVVTEGMSAEQREAAIKKHQDEFGYTAVFIDRQLEEADRRQLKLMIETEKVSIETKQPLPQIHPAD